MTHAELKELLESGAKVTLWGAEVTIRPDNHAYFNGRCWHPTIFNAIFKNAPEGTFVIEKPEPIAVVDSCGWIPSSFDTSYFSTHVKVKSGHESAFTEYVKAFRGKE